MKNRVVVISVDAMVREDLPILLAMPNCSALFKKRLVVQQMETVYPSLTHPVHASLITGRPCGETGIVHNERVDPNCANPTWYNKLSDICCETLFHSAHRAKLTCGVARWPVTAQGNECIDYLVPEILDADLADGVSMEQMLSVGGSAPIIESIIRPNLHLLYKSNARPGYDAFSAACAADMLRLYTPNLLFTHWGMVDSARHKHGLFGTHINAALEYIDRWIGLVARAAETAGILPETNFIILSDHGQLGISQVVRLNALLAQKGLIETDERGALRDYRAYAHGCGMGAQIYLRDPSDAQLTAHVHRILSEDLPHFTGIEFELLTCQEARERFGLYGDFSFVIETDGTTFFENEAKGPVFETLDTCRSVSIRATHGHMPDKGPQPPLLATGPAFKCQTLPHGHILEVAPTIAALMGLELKGCSKSARLDWFSE